LARIEALDWLRARADNATRARLVDDGLGFKDQHTAYLQNLTHRIRKQDEYTAG